MLGQPGKQVNQEHKDQWDHKARRDRRGHKDFQGNWGLQVKRAHKENKVHKVHKAQQGPRVPGSAMEMPRATLSIGTGLCGRT